MKLRLFANLLGAVALAVSGCSDSATSEVPKETAASSPVELGVRVSDVESALSDAFDEASLIRFRSWNGIWQGTDCDTDIELLPNRGLVLTEYGYAVRKYAGTYRIVPTDDGLTVLEFSFESDYHGSWPPLAVYAGASNLLLRPVAGSHDVVFGNRAGATLTSNPGLFWPFRQIPAMW